MFVTPAQAHSAIDHTVFDHQSPVLAQAAGGSDILMSILPFILIFVIMYFLILRPQRRQVKARQEMLSNIRRGDTIVTGGGVVGKVTKVIDDNELETAVLEKMVEKLARIVKHVTNDNDLIVDENVDKATASWLKDNYAASSTHKKDKKSDKVLGHEEELAKAKQLQSAHENVDPTIVNSWGFDVLKYNYDELYEYNRYLLDVFGIFQEFTVPVEI